MSNPLVNSTTGLLYHVVCALQSAPQTAPHASGQPNAKRQVQWSEQKEIKKTEMKKIIEPIAQATTASGPALRRVSPPAARGGVCSAPPQGGVLRPEHGSIVGCSPPVQAGELQLTDPTHLTGPPCGGSLSPQVGQLQVEVEAGLESSDSGLCSQRLPPAPAKDMQAKDSPSSKQRTQGEAEQVDTRKG